VRGIVLILIVCAGSLALTGKSAVAQLGIYGQVNATHDPSTTSWYTGFTAGVYGDFIHAGPVRAGLDLCAAYAKGNQYGYRDFLIGPRLEVNPPLLPIRPYAEALVGIGGAEYKGTSRLATHYDNKFQYGLAGGLDWHLISRIDLRVAEVEYLRMSSSSSQNTSVGINLVTLGAGIAFRLP
jgi:hypothetical protein